MTAVANNPGASDGTATTRTYALAARLRCTEGQLYSMVIALTAATALVVAGGVPLGSAPGATAAAGLLPATAPPAVSAVPPAVTAPLTAPGGPPSTSGPGAVPPQPYVPPVQSSAGSTPNAAGAYSSPATAAGSSDFRVPAPGEPRALTSDAASVYVGTDNAGKAPSRLVVFSRTGQADRLFTVTGQPATRTGGLSAAALHGPDLLVTDRGRAALLQINPRTGEQEVLAQLPDLPACVVGVAGTCQPGAQDLAPAPEGLVVAGPNAYIADAAQGTIWRYTLATKQLTAWYSSSDFSMSGPSGLALDKGGNLIFTVAQTTDPAALLLGALYRIQVTSSGTAGTRTLLASFANGATPGPVAAGSTGSVYVGLSSAGGIVVVRPDGTVSPVPGAAAGRFPAPGGLSLAAGALFVADAGRPATPSSGSVRSVAVNDGPST